MKAHLLRLIAAACAGLVLAAGGAGAEPSSGGFRRLPLPPPGHNGFHGFPVFWPVERETVYIEREVIREGPAAPAPPPEPPPPPRKPYVVGASYDSLPGGCMKLIEDGASFYFCGGEWYRQVGARSYKAVARP